MAKFLVIIELVLLVYCLVDCLQTEPAAVRTLPKPLWVLLIIVLPLFGGVGWLLAGKPEGAPTGARRASWPSTSSGGSSGYERPQPPRGPDDDPEFLRSLHKADAERDLHKADAERERDPHKGDTERERDPHKADTEREHNLEQWEQELQERERKLGEGEQPPDRPADAGS